MPGYYIYLASSLPMLHFGAKPPFTSERFLKMCEGLVSEADTMLLENPSLLQWQAFDTALRNELVKIRAGRIHKDPLVYLREGASTDTGIAVIAANACRNPSILDAEKYLDEQRWRFLDELLFGHYFDIDFLIIYALKLRILQRWEKIAVANKSILLEEVLTNG
ncbi:MAG: hypothetical protein COZ98_03950 [Candidatus Omnitrophica bacterium CG_4_8_14_3_um_filter_43_15]|nr:MAG: hypothetical protein AUJ89_04085 [Candidatus Omnitrophica bacterium CG1_02_43_210]PIW68508.1 MAG: hypothetical protein COW10_02170 [Candidatus Omnitrophica bacterium CG12_big_fil_rev_8_21_14_0_65_42_8]PIW80127.1 MAG: hypothetical protein COZ98_03950 [Candidatus Omnitrophica bacterium CG_4_8_14_3_um_filter_43_15]